MKKTILAAVALVAMVSCNKNLIENPMLDSNYGYINLGITADTEMVVTKAEDVPVYNNYYVTLTGDNTSWTKQFSNIVSSDWTVPAGSYTITIANYESLDNVYKAYNNKGDKYIYGTGEVNVTAGNEHDCPITCKVNNSKVSFASDEKFRAIFSMASIEIKEKEGSRQSEAVVGESHVDANTIYFEPTTLVWTLNTTSNLNGKRVYTGEITTVKSKWTEVTFTTGNTAGQINVIVTVDDTMTVEQLTPISVDPFEGNAAE
jgi:hypothetical protein